MDDEDLNNLVAVMSTRGHFIQQEYIPKEMAIKCFGDGKPLVVHFYNEDLPWNQLQESDKLFNSYIHDTMFDIPYRKYWFGMFYPSSIQHVLQACKQHYPPEAYDLDKAYNPIDITIGYYGGAYEKAALDLAGIKSLNLQEYGCPTVNQLQSEYINNNIEIQFTGCNLHTNATSTNCCRSDVLLYEHWVLNDVYAPNKSILHKSYQSKNILNFIDLEHDFVKPF